MAVTAPIGEDSGTGETAIRDLVDHQREAFLQEGAPSLEVRRERLDRLEGLVLKHQDEFVDAMASDFGYRDSMTTRMSDLVGTLEALRYTRRRLSRWMKPSRRGSRFPLGLLGARSWVEYSPLGVIGIMSPWNFPVNLSLWPLCDAIGAGNRAMIKPSELTPQTAALIGRLVGEYFRPEEVAVVTGGPDVAKAFAAQPWDHLIYTGSGRVGQAVMHAAADKLVPVTLELGGKSPTILGGGARLPLAMRRILAGKIFNAGQICLAPDYLLVPRAMAGAVVAEAHAAFAQMAPQRVFEQGVTSLLNEAQLARMRAYLEEARAAGAQIIDLGEGFQFGASAARALAPALVMDPPAEARIMNEEIFGPLLPVRSYDSFDEAIDFVNARPNPLAIYYFGQDQAEQQALLRRTRSGGLNFNDVMVHAGMFSLPFGGVGASGTGAYHGHAGFLNFSHQRAVFSQTGFDIGKVERPPYGKLLRSVVAKALKR